MQSRNKKFIIDLKLEIIFFTTAAVISPLLVS